jgi:4a-hydroxytetrahydrobiopterin dehydratase
MADTLSADDLRRQLAALPGWDPAGDAVRKTFEFPSFPEAVAFVNRVAEGAERADHHPDILISYRRVTLSWSTHSAGGVTGKDIEGARMADRCV